MPKPTHAQLRGEPFPQRPVSRSIPLLGYGERNYTLADFPHPSTLPRSLAVHPDFYARHLSPEGNPALHAHINRKDFLPRRIKDFGSAVRVWTDHSFPERQHSAVPGARPHQHGTRFITHHRTVVAAFFASSDGNTRFAYLHYGISGKTDETVKACESTYFTVFESLYRGLASYTAARTPHLTTFTDGPLLTDYARVLPEAAHPSTTVIMTDCSKPNDRDAHPPLIIRLVLPEPYVAIPGRPALSRPDKMFRRGTMLVPPGIGCEPFWSRSKQGYGARLATHAAPPKPTTPPSPPPYTRDELEAAATAALVEVLDPRVTPLAHVIHHQLREAGFHTPTSDVLNALLPYTVSVYTSDLQARILHDTALALLQPDTLRPRTHYARVKAVLGAIRRAENAGYPLLVLNVLAGLIALYGIPYAAE